MPLEQLKFPVLVIQPGGVPVFAEWDSTALEKFPQGSARTPGDGTVIVDSDFNQYTQQDVKRQSEGELKAIARFLVPSMRVKYTFNLRRATSSGRDALMQMIRQAPPFSDNAAEDTAMRTAAQQHPTMDGVLEALHFYKPVEPATQPAAEQTPTDQSPPTKTEDEPASPDADKPGMAK